MLPDCILFASNELIYKALLGDALDRLHACFDASMAQPAKPDARLRAGALVITQAGRLRNLGSNLDDVVLLHREMLLAHHAQM